MKVRCILIGMNIILSARIYRFLKMPITFFVDLDSVLRTKSKRLSKSGSYSATATRGFLNKKGPTRLNDISPGGIGLHD